MSCGKPHETDCSNVIEAVYLYLDGEASDDERLRIRVHLDECGPCLRKYGLEQEVRTLVARCCGQDQAPERLRAAVVARLQQVRVEISAVEYRID